jgi:hypothetical protein
MVVPRSFSQAENVFNTRRIKEFRRLRETPESAAQSHFPQPFM